jgi:hypothetical protein
MFNPTVGEVNISEEKVYPGYTRTDFLKSFLYTQVIRELSYSDNIYILKPQTIESEKFFMSICFHGEKLKYISLSIQVNDETPRWETWSKEKQLEKKELHNQWLKRKIGTPPYKYDWGEISSDYDERSGESSIWIQYGV